MPNRYGPGNNDPIINTNGSGEADRDSYGEPEENVDRLRPSFIRSGVSGSRLPDRTRHGPAARIKMIEMDRVSLSGWRCPALIGGSGVGGIARH